MAETLTLTDAGYLAEIIAAVDRRARVTWYPYGADSPDIKCDLVLRSFTHEGGNLWFDKDGDVRDAYVWASGTMEWWLKVSDLMAALKNMRYGQQDHDAPLLTIEPAERSHVAPF